jgi:hypothetical protein
MKNAAIFILVIFFAWCIVSVVKPFWNRYWVAENVEKAAIYGTKNSIESTRKFLSEKIEEMGCYFNEEDLIIEKDEDTITISITYSDEISLFGKTLKQFQFSVKATEHEVEEYY